MKPKRRITCGKVEAAAFSEDGRLLAQTGSSARTERTETTYRVSVATDGHFEDLHLEPFMRVVDLESGELLWQQTSHCQGPKSLAALPGREFLSGGTGAGGGECILWGDGDRARLFPQLDTNTVPALAPLPGRTGFLAACAWDGEVAQVGFDGGVARRLRAHERSASNMLLSVAASGDGRLAAAGSLDGTVHIWDLVGGTPLGSIEAGIGGCRVALSPDGTLAAGGVTGAITTWDARGGGPRRRLEGHTQPVWFLTFSPDGSLLASTGYDGKAKLWSVKSGALLHSIQLEHADEYIGPPAGLAFTDSGRALLAAFGPAVERIDCASGRRSRLFAPR